MQHYETLISISTQGSYLSNHLYHSKQSLPVSQDLHHKEFWNKFFYHDLQRKGLESVKFVIIQWLPSGLMSA